MTRTLILCIGHLLVAPVWAQLPITKTHLAEYMDILGFASVQEDSAGALHEGYVFAQAAIRQERNSRTADLIEQLSSEDASERERVTLRKQRYELRYEYAAKLYDVERTFYADIRALATDDSNYDELQRAILRHEGLYFIPTSLQKLDLIALTRDLDTDGNERITSILNEYDTKLQALLRDRFAVRMESYELGRSGKTRRDDGTSRSSDELPELKDIRFRKASLAARIGELNRHTATRLIQVLPEPARTTVRRHYHETNALDRSQVEDLYRRIQSRPDFKQEDDEIIDGWIDEYRRREDPLADEILRINEELWIMAEERVLNDGDSMEYLQEVRRFGGKGTELTRELEDLREHYFGRIRRFIEERGYTLEDARSSGPGNI